MRPDPLYLLPSDFYHLPSASRLSYTVSRSTLPTSLPMRKLLALIAIPTLLLAQGRGGRPNAPQTTYYIPPAAVWDGSNSAPHADWAVLVRSDTIAAVGPK